MTQEAGNYSLLFSLKKKKKQPCHLEKRRAGGQEQKGPLLILPKAFVEFLVFLRRQLWNGKVNGDNKAFEVFQETQCLLDW